MTKQWNLKQLRDKENLTQTEFAKKVGIKNHTYMSKENGIYPFTADEMFRIKYYFNKSIEEIFLPRDCSYNAITSNTN